MFMYLKNLYENELYSAVSQLALVILSEPNHRTTMPADQYFLTLCYHGYSLYEEHHYNTAEEILQNALLVRKTFMKAKANVPMGEPGVNHFSEVELRYKLALCYKATKQLSEAIATLQIIPTKSRSSKVNMLMFQLIQLNGLNYDKSAILPLKAVLKECPMNLEAITGLAKLGLKPAEILLCIGDSISPSNRQWLGHFIEAQYKIHATQFLPAVESLKMIEANNEMILVLIGQCYFYAGNPEAAVTYLTRAHQISKYMKDGLVTLAAVYGSLDRLEDLEKMTPPNLCLTENTSEYWFILAQFVYTLGKHEKALYFSQRSLNLNPNNNIEASILKAKVFHKTKKYKEALNLLRILENRAAYRFEIYELYVDIYTATNRFREAQLISRRIFKQQGAHLTARSFVLAAKTYFSQSDPQIKAKSKPLLESALTKDPYCLQAVFLLVDLLLELGDSAGAIKLIKKQCAIKPNAKLYAILGDILSKEKNQMKAVESYTMAIKMDPMNQRANTGLMALGQSSQAPDESNHRAYEFDEMLEVPTNAPEAESDEPWSDFEIESR
ncbi:Anaphase-promoting complex subunit 7 [Pseudolycoriella hygida]|uniref:Anaphase-promoting complex subunit 7 n=1 Tax=Pseudolycoriella hygida TaxID=35572 RepID=A0A9Q0MSL5_9DIPT|nr:Anaphase-promoting complex subunit 7 [Pseudolycoriella hygida]